MTVPFSNKKQYFIVISATIILFAALSALLLILRHHSNELIIGRSAAEYSTVEPDLLPMPPPEESSAMPVIEQEEANQEINSPGKPELETLNQSFTGEINEFTVAEELPETKTLPIADAATMKFKKIARIQIALDRLNLSPGCIDGAIGHQTEQALQTFFSLSAQKNPSGKWNEMELEKLADIPEPFIEYELTAADFVTSAPAESWEEKSALPMMDYHSVNDRIAERFHCSKKFLMRINSNIHWGQLNIGDKLIVPNISAHTAALKPIVKIVVDQKNRQLFALDSTGLPTAQFPCSVAKEKAKRNNQTLIVSTVIPHPNYTYSPATFGESGESKLILPPGPRNPVGSVWIALSLPGYGIHGTPVPEQISQTGSHGCIRLHNWNAEKLAKKLTPGTPVEMINADL